MDKAEQLNRQKAGGLFLPHNLPIHEYIYMPNIGSEEFEKFRRHYIQNQGKDLEKYQDKLEPNIIYVVFEITTPDLTYEFYTLQKFNELNKENI